MVESNGYGSVKISRLYVDYIQYAKAIGYVDSYIGGNITDDTQDSNVWDFNPANISRYYHDGIDPAGNFNFGVRFKNWEANPENKQWSRFLGTMNYYGVLGHNFGFQCREGLGLSVVNAHLFNDNSVHGESMFG